MRRAVLVAALAGVAVAGCTSGSEPPAEQPRASATSEPPTESSAPPEDENRIGYASVFLTGTDVFIPFDVFAPPDQEPFGKGEFFVLGYDCLTEEQVPATVVDLDSAAAAGTLSTTWGYPGDGKRLPSSRRHCAPGPSIFTWHKTTPP
jgi:hypothetical protein